MKKYQHVFDKFITIDKAKDILKAESRNTVEYYIKTAKIRYCWICKGEKSAKRLLYKDDVIKIVELRK